MSFYEFKVVLHMQLAIDCEEYSICDLHRCEELCMHYKLTPTFAVTAKLYSRLSRDKDVTQPCDPEEGFVTLA